MQLPWPVLYINLDFDHERDRHMRAQVERAGLHATRLSASAWVDEPAEVRARHYSAAANQAGYFRPLLPGECGCYLSHLRAWQELLRRGAAAMVVLEDDIELQPDLLPLLRRLAQSPIDWDMVKLTSRPHEMPHGRPRQLDQRRALIEYRRVPSRTCAYVLSREGARKLLASRIPFSRPIDVDLRHYWESGLIVRGIVPSPVTLAPQSRASRIASGRARRTQQQRRRKAVFNLRYTALNAWHRSRGRAADTQLAVPALPKRLRGD
jgi:glycosyl transferase family 25